MSEERSSQKEEQSQKKSHSTAIFSLQVLGAILAGLILVGLAFAWRLSQGPISISLLSPYIVDAVNRNSDGLNISIEDTVISWEGWERNLDVKIVDTSFYLPDGQLLATIPEAYVSLSAKALLDQKIAPSSIALVEPNLKLIRDPNGKILLGFGQGVRLDAKETFDPKELLATPDTENKPFSYLKNISVLRANIEYVDQLNDVTIRAPMTTVQLERIGEALILDTLIDVSVGDKPARFSLNASYNLITEILDVKSKIDTLNLASFGTLFEKLSPLGAFNFPVRGEVSALIEKTGVLRDLKMDVSSGHGLLTLPKPVSQTLNIDNFSVKAAYNFERQLLEVNEALLALHKGTLIRTPKPVEDFVPLEELRLKGKYDLARDEIDISQLTFDLGDGPTGKIKALVNGVMDGDEHKINVIGEVNNVEPSNLHRYWPKGLNDDARDWVVNNLFDGNTPRAAIDVSLSLKGEEVLLHHVHGEMEMQGVSVNYLSPLPVVKNAKGWAKFNEKEFNITVTGGEIDRIKVKSGTIDIVGLDEYDQRLNLDLNIESPLKDTLTFIDQKPLEFAKALDLNPNKTSGMTETNLKMSFLLLDDLSWDGVDVSAKSSGKNIRIKDVIFDEDLSDGDIDLSVDKKGMEVSGKITLGTIPAALKWRENFDRNTLFKRRFQLDGMVNDQQRITELKLNFPPFNNDIIQGPVHVDATITEDWNGHGVLETFADLEGALVTIPLIDWTKEPTGAGNVYAKVNFNNERLIGVPYFSIASGDLQAAGSIVLNDEGTNIQTMNISRFDAGRTHISKGTILFSDTVGWEIDLRGNALDFSTFTKNRTERAQKQSKQDSDTNFKGTFSANFEKVWLDEEHPILELAGAITSDGKLWKQAHVTGATEGGKLFSIDLSPVEQNRKLMMSGNDAGGVLRALDLFDDIQGGDLKIDATFNDTVAGRPLVGTIMVDNYRVTKVPALAKVLSLAALTGVLDSLQGEGIGFTSLTAPFKFENDILEFKDGRTNGISIGLTWNGKVYPNADEADLRGTIVPAYGLNSFLGKIPLLGDLFSAGEKGGGLFAWTFNVTGKLENPDVSVNPVSALAPGFLRKIFEWGGDSTGPSTAPQTN